MEGELDNIHPSYNSFMQLSLLRAKGAAIAGFTVENFLQEVSKDLLHNQRYLQNHQKSAALALVRMGRNTIGLPEFLRRKSNIDLSGNKPKKISDREAVNNRINGMKFIENFGRLLTIFAFTRILNARVFPGQGKARDYYENAWGHLVCNRLATTNIGFDDDIQVYLTPGVNYIYKKVQDLGGVEKVSSENMETGFVLNMYHSPLFVDQSEADIACAYNQSANGMLPDLSWQQVTSYRMQAACLDNKSRNTNNNFAQNLAGIDYNMTAQNCFGCELRKKCGVVKTNIHFHHSSRNYISLVTPQIVNTLQKVKDEVLFK